MTSSSILKIQNEISHLKQKGQHYWWDFNLVWEIVVDIKLNFLEKDGYIVEIRKCQQCRNSYDVTIRF
jgi:hypothetical protein